MATRPASRGLDAERCDPPAAPIPAAQRPPAIRRHQQRPQSGKAVRGHKPPGDQLGQSLLDLRAQQPGGVDEVAEEQSAARLEDRKSTRLNSSHPSISYAVFCLIKKVWQATVDGPGDHVLSA